MLGETPGLQPRTSGQAGETQCWSEKERSGSDSKEQNDRMRGKALRKGQGTGEFRATTKLPLKHLERTLPLNTAHTSSPAAHPHGSI